MGLTYIIIGVAAVVIIIVGAAFLRQDRGQVEQRLDQFARARTAQPAARAKSGKASSPMGDALNKALAGRSFADGIAAKLAQADLKLTVGEYLALIVIAVIGGGVIGFLMTKNIFLAPVFAVVGYFIPGIYVGFMQGNRRNRFNDQLGDTINLMVNGLRSGYSVLQAMEAVARELPQPVAGEFDRVVKEVQLGLTLEQALNNLLRRVRSEDLDLVVTAINVQREVGGNLAEILEVISHTIRERVRIKGEVRVLTAQGMITGYVITGLPLALLAMLYFMNPSYVGRLWTSGICGYAMLIAGGLCIVSGFFIIQKIVRIEV